MTGQEVSFGALLRSLRLQAGLTLRQVEQVSEGAVSNAYLSQLESGKRPPPRPALLVTLARVYNTSADVLFERAGYTETPSVSAVDIAYEQVLADRSFSFGTRFPGQLNEDAKRIIIELYERATEKTLLP